MTPADITVGIDIGTTSVKAVAADPDGKVVASARVPHEVRVPRPGRLEHDAAEAWSAGPIRALAEVGADGVAAVSVAAMVPSLAPVDATGMPCGPGLLYGDERGHTGSAASPAESGELVAFLRWLAEATPDAAGYWPAQAVANHALGGGAVLDTSTAATAFPLFDWTAWDETVAAKAGARVDQLPEIVPTAQRAGRVGDEGPLLASGCIDALAEQLVAGADEVGDVLVILGTTLIVWVVTADPVEAEGYFSIPHTTPDRWLTGGPSNAGGLFVNWATTLVGRGNGTVDPARIPVWGPYPRGERVPFHDSARRAALVDLDLMHDAPAARRAVFEASGFAARRIIDRVGGAQRIIATGGGVRVPEWIQALADTTTLAVDCVAVPEGGALGSAWLARLAAELEPGATMADGRRWARIASRMEPDERWTAQTAARYERFLEL